MGCQVKNFREISDVTNNLFLILSKKFKFSRELEQMQNEKRKALLEHESAKLKECDEALHREMREWKAMLVPRKQVSSLT